MDKKTRPISMVPPRDTSQIEKYTQTKSKGMERKIKAEVAILIFPKMDFKSKTIVRVTEGHYIIIKGKIQQEAITLVKCIHPNRST